MYSGTVEVLINWDLAEAFNRQSSEPIISNGCTVAKIFVSRYLKGDFCDLVPEPSFPSVIRLQASYLKSFKSEDFPFPQGYALRVRRVQQIEAPIRIFLETFFLCDDCHSYVSRCGHRAPNERFKPQASVSQVQINWDLPNAHNQNDLQAVCRGVHHFFKSIGAEGQEVRGLHTKNASDLLEMAKGCCLVDSALNDIQTEIIGIEGYSRDLRSLPASCCFPHLCGVQNCGEQNENEKRLLSHLWVHFREKDRPPKREIYSKPPKYKIEKEEAVSIYYPALEEAFGESRMVIAWDLDRNMNDGLVALVRERARRLYVELTSKGEEYPKETVFDVKASLLYRYVFG